MPTKVHLVKAMVFPVVMCGCKSWTIKKAEHRRTDTFELWSWRRLLRVPWTAKRSNQSVLKEINPEYWKDLCQSWNSNTLVTQCEGSTHWKRPWCWERLGEEEKEATENEMVGWYHLTQWLTWVWADSGRQWRTGKPGMLPGLWGLKEWNTKGAKLLKQFINTFCLLKLNRDT